jgi:hypothetical protein
MASRMVAGLSVLFLRARPSFGAMRQESQRRSTASPLPFEIVTSPARTTYIFSMEEASRVVPPPGAGFYDKGSRDEPRTAT